ncbi:hypothetical protein [Nocardioides deserti]|uniref:DUF4333 domain-containing protein n=1 Tax=Nocardioides deserti TaxID=1588644 RepID=A0ABR6U3W0_9ACTN|nr:hypothetical protein [Nocardioides deserti]MBC2958863.1 hypothetical protein [Nocardioides deserti]GGO69429.1 hypothetical protein GCM10012276_05600 [Nocardioides deserti]
MTLTRAASATLTLVALAAVAACSTEPTYDAGELAAKVVAEQEEVTPDLEVVEGSCEEDVPLEVDEVIGCTVLIDGVEAPYDVTVTALEDETARYEISPARAIISVQAVVDALQAELEGQGVSGVEVDCGADAVRVEDPDTSFTCGLSLGGQTREATVTVQDLQGNVRYEF